MALNYLSAGSFVNTSRGVPYSPELSSEEELSDSVDGGLSRADANGVIGSKESCPSWAPEATAEGVPTFTSVAGSDGTGSSRAWTVVDGVEPVPKFTLT